VVGAGRTSWAQAEAPVLPSGQPVGSKTITQNGLSWNAADGAPLDAVVSRAQDLGFGTGGFIVYFPEDEVGSYWAVRWPDLGTKPNQSALDEKFAYIDQYSAEEVGSYSFADYGVMAKAVDFGISLHEGREWGIWSQLAALVGTLAILVSASTAVVMWYKRRPQGGLGAPRRVYSDSALAGLTIITLTLGVFFPLVGLSIIVLFLFDFLILRRIPVVARFFGMSGPSQEAA
jgi:uncharacterized iron-regulated membrane protein